MYSACAVPCYAMLSFGINFSTVFYTSTERQSLTV
jgi:hypothetical protein